MTLYLRQLELGPMQNFVYLLGDRVAKSCFVVDPAWEVEDALAEAAKDGFRIDGVLLSHSHYDHCNALETLLKTHDVPVYLQREEIDIAQSAANSGIFGPLPKSNLKIVNSGDKISIGSTEVTFLHTPGHTPGSQCFLVNGRLLSGDTLFLDTCGRCDIPGGDPKRLYESLNGVIGKLPADTLVFPGHNYSPSATQITLKDARKTNRFFCARSLEHFLEMMEL